VVLVISLTQ